MEHARFLEELSLNAYPCFQTLHYDGWVLRMMDGFTRRANSVQLLYPGSLPLEEKIDYCESIYATASLRTVFKITDATRDDLLAVEAATAARGYEYDCLTRVQTCTLSGLPAPEGRAWAALDGFLTPAWVEDFARLRPLTDEERIPFARQQVQILPRVGYVRLIVEGVTVAVAMGVVERGWLGVYDVIVEPALRRKGFGRQLMMHLLNWGAAQGATHAYLQVMAGNTAALKLYAGLGFQTAYSYWYRQKDV